MSDMRSPRCRDVTALQEWFQRPALGGVYLTGRDRNVWAEGTDLMSLAARQPSNQASSWIGDSLFPRYHRASMLVEGWFVCGKEVSPRDIGFRVD